MKEIIDVIFEVVDFINIGASIFVLIVVIKKRSRPWRWRKLLTFWLCYMTAPIFILAWGLTGFRKTYAKFDGIIRSITSASKEA